MHETLKNILKKKHSAYDTDHILSNKYTISLLRVRIKWDFNTDT